MCSATASRVTLWLLRHAALDTHARQPRGGAKLRTGPPAGPFALLRSARAAATAAGPARDGTNASGAPLRPPPAYTPPAFSPSLVTAITSYLCGPRNALLVGAAELPVGGPATHGSCCHRVVRRLAFFHARRIRRPMRLLPSQKSYKVTEGRIKSLRRASLQPLSGACPPR